MSSPVRVLVVGVGSMGGGMALHLASLPAFHVLGFDQHHDTLLAFTAQYRSVLAASTHSCAADLVQSQTALADREHAANPFPHGASPDVVIFMVVNSQQIHDFLFAPLGGEASASSQKKHRGEACFASSLPPSATVLVMSTCSPSAVLEMHARLAVVSAAPPALIDAPVSGGPARARNGTLSIMLSACGDASDSAYMKVLTALSNGGAGLTLFPPLAGHAHALGAGSMAKALHQLLAGVHVVAAGEALSLARQCGLDLAVFYGMVTGGAAGNSWMFTDRGQRMVASMAGEEVDTKSRMTIFIKDLGIVLDEARKATGSDNATAVAPLARSALDCFERAVSLGLGDEDDSSMWKVFRVPSMTDDDATLFSERDVVDVGSEPMHKIKLHNAFTRAVLVHIPEGVTSLPHLHSVDSVYLFLNPTGSRVKNRMKGQSCISETFEFGEVRYGTHCACPLTHRIHAEVAGGGIFCVDAEVLAPPPLLTGIDGEALPEVETMEGHQLIKLREKVRVFRATLAPGASLETTYAFFHVSVVIEGSSVEVTCEGSRWREERKAGDMFWSGPSSKRVIKNEGSTVFSIFIIQWRNFLVR